MVSLYGLSELSFYWLSAIWLVTPCSTWHSSNMEPTTLIKLYHVLTQVVYFIFEEKNKLFSPTIFCNNEISGEYTLIMLVNYTPATWQQKSADDEIAEKLLRTWFDGQFLAFILVYQTLENTLNTFWMIIWHIHAR